MRLQLRLLGTKKRAIIMVAMTTLILQACQAKPESQSAQVSSPVPDPRQQEDAGVEVSQPSDEERETPVRSPEGQEDTDLEVLRRSEGEPQISIDQITENGPIRGHVTGLVAGSAEDFNVVIYVHTDQWYVHPFAGQGRGRSWTVLQRDLSWAIRSVKRAYVADEVAALLVTEGLNPPPTIWSLEEIQSVAWVVVRGTGAV